MATSTDKVRSLDPLEKEIRRLQQKAKQLEQKIDDNFTYFQQHSGTLFFNSLLPRKTEEEPHPGGYTILGNVLYTLLQNEKLRKNLGKLTNNLAERLGEGLNKLINRIFKE